MPTRQPTFPLYDKLVDGKLAEILRDLYDGDRSLYQTALALRKYGIEVSPTTVSRWIKEFVNEEPAA